MEETVEDATFDPRALLRKLGRTRRVPRTTRHAEERWSERVVGSSTALAPATLERFRREGRRRPRPRHWTRTSAEPGTTFVYLAAQPDVRVVLRGRVAVTVLTRALCRRAGQ